MTKTIPEPTPEEKKWIATGLTIALELIPEDRIKFIKGENVYKHYNIALKDTRKAINDYFNSL